MSNVSRHRITGTIGLENRIQQSREIARYDAAGKKLLQYKEVLATILKYGVAEYAAYSCEEIMGFIDGDSISDAVAIAPDTDTRIHENNSEQTSVNETNLSFDVLFQAVKPITGRNTSLWDQSGRRFIFMLILNYRESIIRDIRWKNGDSIIYQE